MLRRWLENALLWLRGIAIVAFLIVATLAALPPLHGRLSGWLNASTGGDQSVSIGEDAGPGVASPWLREGPPLVTGDAESAAALPITAVSGRSASRDPQYANLTRRLTAAGASSFHLDDPSSPSGRYRFRCQTQLARGSAYRREFLACDSDPLRAMQIVLADVERWRAAGGGQTATVRRRNKSPK